MRGRAGIVYLSGSQPESVVVERRLSSTFRNFRSVGTYGAVQKISSAAMNSSARSIGRDARPRDPARVHRSFQSDQ